ncbi:uncharacterized protein DS421_9g276110 [Arachis hypogaea]|nr:uncharacterized protein DS421_9g276110 [Arachis hypogaea]
MDTTETSVSEAPQGFMVGVAPMDTSRIRRSKHLFCCYQHIKVECCADSNGNITMGYLIPNKKA